MKGGNQRGSGGGGVDGTVSIAMVVMVVMLDGNSDAVRCDTTFVSCVCDVMLCVVVRFGRRVTAWFGCGG
jgi:hypothetical protein